MTLLKLNGVDVTPGLVKMDIDDMDVHSDDSGRKNESAIMFLEIIRADVASLSVEWQNLTASQLAAIRTEIDKKVMIVDYFDGTMKTAKMYVGSRKVSHKILNGEQFSSISFSLIAM